MSTLHSEFAAVRARADRPGGVLDAIARRDGTRAEQLARHHPHQPILETMADTGLA